MAIEPCWKRTRGLAVSIDMGLSPRTSEAGGGNPHVVLVGTKPDIIKQAPIYHELKSRGHNAVVCHTGQHFDHNLSGAMLEEFGIDRSVNLRAAGSPIDLISRITERLGWYLTSLEEEVGPPVTYVHGDTTTAMAGALAAFSLGQGLVHVEAGLRTLSPVREVLVEWLDRVEGGDLDWARFKAQTVARETYERGSRDPSPEQLNTRVADASAQFHAAPVELNREFLIEDGFAPQSIDVVGNSVVDALEQSITNATVESLLDRVPQLATGRVIRYCVHRRENTTSRTRFLALMEGMEQLLEQGHSILFIRLNGTEAAIDAFGMRDWLHGLERRFGDSFITSGVWDSYAHVLAAMKMCAVVATDSGSIQEEVNVLGVPCVTLRFGSDRGESLLAGTNFLAPPTSKSVVAQVIQQVFDHRGELEPRPVYPYGASKALVSAVEERMSSTGRLESSEEWRYGLS